MGIQIRLEGLDEVIGKLNNMANGANSGLKRGLLQGEEGEQDETDEVL